MRAIWKGSITFGLVTIPISLYPATKTEELKFHLLRDSDLSPVNYKRIAVVDGKEVPWEHIVKGYEYAEGKYVVLKDEDFKRVDVEATRTVDIIHFVRQEEIDPMFFAKPYYMEPQKNGKKAYVLLREVLRETGLIGIAKLVIKTRQYLAGVKPERNCLLLETMHFADELVPPEQFSIPSGQILRKQEMAMARELVNSMRKKWDPNEYHDDYRENLLELIKKKIKSGGKELPETAPEKRPQRVDDLVSALRESINKSHRSGKRRNMPVRLSTRKKTRHAHRI